MMKLKLLKETHSKIKTFYCCKENWRKRYILVEKIISGDKFNNPYQNSIEKNPEIIKTVESNYKISRSVYQFVFADVTNIFIEYIYLLDQDEIFKLKILNLRGGEQNIYLKLKMILSFSLYFKDFAIAMGGYH